MKTTETTLTPGLYHYCPERKVPRPSCQIEADMGHNGKHWFLWTPFVLRAPGVVRLEPDFGPSGRRAGWNRYRATNRAFTNLCAKYSVSSERNY